MKYKICSYLTGRQRRCYGKYWRRSSIIRNLLSVKHHAPYKWMYSKYQIIQILESCFQNINYFSWIRLTPVLIYLKYSYYNFPHLELLCLPTITVICCSSQLKRLFNTILIMFFIGLSILSLTIRHHNCWIN